MHDHIRTALETLAQKGQVTVAGLGTFRRSTTPARSTALPNPFTGATQVVTMPARHRLRFERSEELEAIVESGALPSALEADPIVREALEALVRTNEAAICGLGSFERTVRPLERLEGINPITGEPLTIEGGGAELHFSASAALDDVVHGKPIPTVAPDADFAEILAAYPVDAAWTSELLLAHLTRRGRHRPRATRKGLDKKAPPIFVEVAARVGDEMRARARPYLAEGHYDLSELFDDAREIFRDGNGDRWVAIASGDDPECHYVTHEGGDHAFAGGPLTRLLAAWVFHDEATACIGERIVSPAVKRALNERLGSLCAAARTHGASSFGRFRA